MKARNVSRANVVLTALDNELCINGDALERKKITGVIYALYKVRKSVVLVDLEAVYVNLEEHSSLYYVHKPFSMMLRERVTAYHADAVAKVTSLGLDVWLEGGGDGSGVKNRIESDPEGQALIELLTGALQQTGGAVRSDAGEASYAQWMRFHGLNVPTDIEQLEKLLNFLQWELRPSERIEHYWEQINGHDGDTAALTSAQCQEIRSLTARLVPGGKNLLEYLYEKAKPVLYDAIDWTNADDVVFDLMHHEFSYGFAAKYIDALGWWGARTGEQIEAGDLAQILYTAIILQLDPDVGNKTRRNVIAGYDIYAPGISADKSLESIRQGFDQHLIDSNRVSSRLAPLASHLLLSTSMPCLLVEGVPAWLTAGSIGWVTFCQSLRVIELNTTGASRFLHYDDVMLFADFGSVSNALGQLQGLTAVDVVIDWGLINEVISHEELDAAASEAVQKALDAYRVFVETMVNGTKTFSTLVPNRKKLAKAALERAIPGCDFLEEPLLRPEPYSAMRCSMLDLHIEGELTSGPWDWNQSPHILDQYPQLVGLTPNQTVFLADVQKFHLDIHRAMASNIKLALASMPREDRNIFEKSRITFFTVRHPVTELIYPTDTNYNQVGVANKTPRQVEVQAKKDQARGRFALIMVASYGNSQIRCYELFSLLGECRRNDELGRLILETKKMSMPARLDFTGSLNDLSHPLPETHGVPTDFQSYTQGTRPLPNSSGRMVIEKLGVLSAPSNTSGNKRSIYQFFMSAHFDNIAKFVVAHRPIGSVTELVEAFTELTEREQTAKQTDEAVTYIVDLIVPFKKCIEDLASGERNKVVDGLYGCTMDAIGILFTILGAPATILKIAARTTSLVAKISSAVKFGLTLTVSVFNPVDGLPTAGYKAGRSLLKSGIELGSKGVKVFEAATFELHRLTGRCQAVDFLKRNDLLQIGQGVWRPRGSTAGVVNICAMKKNDQWFAISSRGKPWGEQLTSFEFQHSLTLPTLRPESYTRHIVEQSLPSVQKKLSAALNVLDSPVLNLKTDMALGLFLGTTDQARDKFGVLLRTIRLDIRGFSISNCLLDTAKVDDQIMQIDQRQYLEWKQSSPHQRANVQYLAIRSQHLNDRFNAANFNYGEIADDLIHEVFRTQPGITDLVSANASLKDGTAAVNVAPLLNLATGRHPKPGHAAGYYSSADTWLNSDSLALLVALLSQMLENPPAFSMNMSIMNAAIKSSAGRPIESEVWLHLNSE